MDKEFDYAEDLQINPEDLDVEWLDQPRLFMRYAEQEAIARGEMDRAKENIDVVSAELDSSIRMKPERFDIAKITESAVRAAILQSKKHKEAQEKYNESKLDYDLIRAAVRAFEMRKYALENLVKLQMQGYFAAPSEPRNLSEEYSKKGMKEKRGLDKTRPSRRKD